MRFDVASDEMIRSFISLSRSCNDADADDDNSGFFFNNGLEFVMSWMDLTKDSDVYFRKHFPRIFSKTLARSWADCEAEMFFVEIQ